MLEVHNQTRAGRPTLLLVTCALVLTAMVALAFVQVRVARALGDPVAIPGTPLTVRPPAGWVQDPRDPGSFSTTHRTIRFTYERASGFRPALYLLEKNNYIDAAVRDAFDYERGRIGDFLGVQARRHRIVQWRGRPVEGETIYRVVGTPRGDEIAVEYSPVGELSPGDRALFDEVCVSVRLEAAPFEIQAEQAFGTAGARVPLPDNTVTIAHDVPHVPGFTISHTDRSGLVDWTIGVFRTWIMPGQTPEEILEVFGTRSWFLFGETTPMVRAPRGDGARSVVIRHPDLPRDGGGISAVWLIAASPQQAALIFVHANDKTDQDANRAAQQIVDQIEFLSDFPVEGVESAYARGRDLVDQLHRGGLSRAWGATAAKSLFIGSEGGSPVFEVREHGPARGRSGSGYTGREIRDRLAYPDPAGDMELGWRISADSDEYYCRATIHFLAPRIPPLELEEEFFPRRGEVRRSFALGRRTESHTLEPGPAFVPPPASSVTYAAVSLSARESALIEVSTLLGPALGSELLIPIESETTDEYALLVLSADWPLGTILRHAPDGSLLVEQNNVARVRRATQSEAEQFVGQR